MAKPANVELDRRSSTPESDTVTLTASSAQKKKPTKTIRAKPAQKGKKPVSVAQLPEKQDQDETSDDDMYEVEKIVSHKFNRKGNVLYQVRWKGYDEDDDTFEPEENLLPSARSILTKYHTSIGGKPEAPKKNAKRKTPVPKRPTSSRPRSKATRTTVPTPEITQTPTPTPPKRMKPTIDAEELQDKSSDIAQGNDDDEDDWTPKSADWDDLIEEVETVDRDTNGNIVAYIRFKNGKRAKVAQNMYYAHCPRKVLSFYEKHLSIREQSN